MSNCVQSECYTVMDRPNIFRRGDRLVTLAQVIKQVCDLIIQIYWEDLSLEQGDQLRVTFIPEVKRWDFCIKAEWVIERARK